MYGNVLRKNFASSPRLSSPDVAVVLTRDYEIISPNLEGLEIWNFMAKFWDFGRLIFSFD